MVGGLTVGAQSIAAQRHADWIGMLQPDGLVVSVPVLEELDLYARQPQEVVVALREATDDDLLPDLDTLAGLLGWTERFLVAPPADLRLDLADLQATVAPTHVVRDRSGTIAVLVQWTEAELDKPPSGSPWPANLTERFERLLTHTDHPVGLQVTPRRIRLIFAPRGEAPGRLTFPVSALRTSDGRLLVDALHMLLGARRVIAPPRGRSLLDVLRASRDRQEKVTDELAGQVQEALEVLLAGLDRADKRTKGRLLRDVDGEAVYDGITTMLLRLVFLLYAEDRGLLPMDRVVYAEHYSVASLGDQLARDAVAHGEAQTRRFGAWARLLSLTRMVFDGAPHEGMTLPPRRGDLFDPDRHPFLEGRPKLSSYKTDPVDVPPIDDAVIHGVLDRLLHLEGQRISYRNLEVEQLGSVYEALMGYEVRRAATPAVRLKSGCWVELGDLAEAEQPYLYLQEVTGERNAKLRKQIPDLASYEPAGDADADRAAVAGALEPLLDGKRPTLPAQRHYLQPGAERRNSGSHYTPRTLTQPLVARTLAPLLGEAPTPEHIEGLRICDPAMGSGAFLAEVVRQLADALVEAWARTGATPKEGRDPLVLARRRVAERCVFGVDRNPRATVLARLSLWLITSTHDLPFTFVDHNLKTGDALIGLDLEQVAAFDFQPSSRTQLQLKTPAFRQVMQTATRIRGEIVAEQRRMTFAVDEHRRQKSFLSMADEEVWDERRVADLLVACAWDYGSKTKMKALVEEMGDWAWTWYPNPDKEPLPGPAAAVLDGLPMRPFHWWLEFPEVFGRKNPGFDGVVGNPPFGGKNTILAENGAPYIKLLQALWPHAHGAADLCAYFFLRAEQVLQDGGHFGLVASNTIKQGNTLDTGLRYLVNETEVTLTAAETDLTWPVRGAAVVVDRVSGTKGDWQGPFLLNGDDVRSFSSDLSEGPELSEPVRLRERAGICFQGSNVLGKGFVLDPAAAEKLLAEDPRRADVLRPYIGGRELNNNVPERVDGHIPHDRYVIAFGERTESQARDWPELMDRVLRLVKPERDRLKDNPDGRRRKANWWRFGRETPGLERALQPLETCFVASMVSKSLLFAVQPTDRVFSHALNVLALEGWVDFAVLQSRVHEAWARLLGSSMKKDLRYTPSTCFETFPFPRPTSEQADTLAWMGEDLYQARAEMMVAEQIGMTQVWNRLHDPHDHEPDIVRLRELRDAMDRAVLDAYGWNGVDPDDSVEIVTRLRKLNAERAAEEAAQAAEGGKRRNTR